MMETVLNEESVVQLLADLVKIKSPYFEEDEVMAYANEWLNANEVPSYIFEYDEDKITHFHGKNVVATLKGRSPGLKICFNGHLDTVNLCEGWTKNPWGERDGDRFYGLGTVDMTGGVVAEMLAMKAFKKKYGSNFSGEVIGTFVSDEEGPFGLGTDAIINSGLLDGTDVSICCEPNAPFCNAEFPSVSFGCHGLYAISVELTGISAHASRPWEGVNAIEDASKIIIALEQTELRSHPKMGKSVCCVLGIENEIEPASVPSFARLRLLRHTVPGDTRETMREEVEEAIKRANIKSTWKIAFREAPSIETSGFLAYAVDEDSHFSNLLLDCTKEICGVEPSRTYFGGCTDCCYLVTRLNGAPAYLIGPTGAGFHGIDEYVTISSVLATAKILFRFLEESLL